jgi:hypothetical protein
MTLRFLRLQRPSSAKAARHRKTHENRPNLRRLDRHTPCTIGGQVNRDLEGMDQVNRIRTATVAALLASFVAFQPAPVTADQGRGRWEREQQRERREAQRERREDRREARRDWREDRREDRRDYWDASRYYQRDDRRYRARRLNRSDRVYRGSDNRYYCKRDDGTTGLIVGGITGGVLGNVIAPGGWKTLGTIIGAGSGALIGRAIDDGDVVCR